MFSRNPVKWSKRNFRPIQKYRFRCYIIVCISTVILFLILQWKYEIELLKLNDMVKVNMRKVKKMSVFTTINTKINDTWRIPDSENAGIFSAYLDLRPEVVLEEAPNASYDNFWALIRIIAIIPVKLDKYSVTCYYEFPPAPSNLQRGKKTILKSPVVSVRIIAAAENFGMQYSAAFVLCKLITTDDGRLPLKVTFSSSGEKTIEELEKIDFVDIHYTNYPNFMSQDRFMSVCIPSLHRNYDKHANLVEFVEFYRMMGVEHFTFYNTSISSQVSQVLSYYRDIGVATVIQWKLPPQYLFERNLRYNGIFAAINECLYRSTMMDGYKYVINVDLDEFIVPKKYKNFRELMNYLDPHPEENNYAAFIMRNMFFYLMYEDSTIPQSPPGKGSWLLIVHAQQYCAPRLLLHTKTKRWDEINPAYERSKYIAKGQEIIELGNHRVWSTKKRSLLFRYLEKIVDPDVAGSHHYRYCEVNELVCWLRDTVVDETAHNFTKELGSRVAVIFNKLFKPKNSDS